MPQFFGVPQFSSNDGAGYSLLLGGGGSAREALEYGHGVISSAQSTLFFFHLWFRPSHILCFTNSVLWELFILSCAGHFLLGAIPIFMARCLIMMAGHAQLFVFGRSVTW